MTIQADTKTMLKAAKWTVRRLANESGINESALSRFLNKKKSGKSISEKLYPFIVGDKRPPDKPPHHACGVKAEQGRNRFTQAKLQP